MGTTLLASSQYICIRMHILFWLLPLGFASLASSSLIQTLCYSSFTTYMNLPCGLPVFLPPSSFTLTVLCQINILLSLLTESLCAWTWLGFPFKRQGSPVIFPLNLIFWTPFYSFLSWESRSLFSIKVCSAHFLSTVVSAVRVANHYNRNQAGYRKNGNKDPSLSDESQTSSSQLSTLA